MRLKHLLKSISSSFGWWFVWTMATALVLDIIYAFFHPGVKQVPESWSSAIVSTSMIVAVILTIITKRIRKKKKNTSSSSSSPEIKTGKNSYRTNAHTYLSKMDRIPVSKKRQVEIAKRILANIEVCVSLANKSDKVSHFVEWYDECIDGFATLMRLDKVKFQNPPSHDYYKFKDEYQWHLCDAIVRAKDATISDIKNKYRNSREFQARTVNAFEYDINSIRNRFSIDTAVLADQAVVEVQNAIGVQAHTPSIPHEIQDQFSKYGGTQAELLTIDLMEGHAFEYWCAKLLTDIGYSDVKVTQGSGDQGVDVLAVKDGIRYAIQCKCYSKDLGNGPVQEVNAGKSIYHCQIGVVMTNRYFTKGAKDAAEANGILLWDRDWITNAIKNRNI